MPTLSFRFPGGRYHATPWGHHVNEGLIEWPPSPWRLLRALLSCGFTRDGWETVPDLGRSLLEKLAAVLPSYRLPAAAAAHSRHYMPLGLLAKGREQTTLVFDTWADVRDETLFVHWPCDLTADETALLARLASALGYLGRSESWVEAELVADSGEKPDAFPCQDGQHPGREYEQLSLMAAIPPTDYATWRVGVAEEALKPLPLPEGKKKAGAKLLKDREKAVAPYPAGLMDCLTRDTVWWKGHGWSQPPGSRRVLYWRPSDALQVGPPTIPVRPSPRAVTTVLLALTTPTGNRSALPPVTRALPLAELFHRCAVGKAGNGGRVHCPELTGKDERGQPLHDRHEHAHTVPLDLDGDEHLDHILVHAKMGLGGLAQQALRRVKKTYAKGVPDIQVAVAGSGDLGLLRRLSGRAREAVLKLLGPTDGSRVWESVTPFVCPRFLKARGRNSLFGQINAELVSRGLPEAQSVEIVAGLTKNLRHHVRRRNHGGVAPPVDYGHGLRLTFADPLRLDEYGPLALGYAAHFGLGLFGPT